MQKMHQDQRKKGIIERINKQEVYFRKNIYILTLKIWYRFKKINDLHL